MTENSYFIHPSSFVDDDVEIGEGTKIWHFCHIQRGARIGARCSLGQNVNVSNNVCVGNGCKLQNNVSLYEGVELENDVFCGPSCVFTNDLTPRAKYPKGHENYKKTLIREGASIGANATVVCGHTVGRWAMIGAGAVVASDVPDHALMLGVPARLAGYVFECGARLHFNKNAAKCGRCEKMYRNDEVEAEMIATDGQMFFEGAHLTCKHEKCIMLCCSCDAEEAA